MIFIFVPGYCKWIGLILGFVFRRFAGAIAGCRQQATPPPRQSSLQDAYDELGISPTATDDEVRAAYKRVALLYHPDRVANLDEAVRSEAERRFKRINEARDRIFRARGMNH